MSDELTRYICKRIAEGLVERGIPWHWVHCGMCGEPGPDAEHVCPDMPCHLTGILSVPD